MTTVANRLNSLEGEDGQSVLEFLLMLPMMVGLVMLMIRVNSAIQVSIVDQQYARAQALFLAFDSPIFPQLSQRIPNLDQKNYNQITMGVSDNLVATQGGTYVPSATEQYIARTPAAGNAGNTDNQVEPNPDQGGLRASVRIRNTVSLCTQIAVVQSANGLTPAMPVSISANNVATATGNSALTDSPQQFAWCKGELMNE